MRKAETTPTRLILGSAAASLAALGIVVVASTLSPPATPTCTKAPMMEPVDRVPSYQMPPTPPAPAPKPEYQRPRPPPSK